MIPLHVFHSTIRSILKKEQGEKIAPYIFKINDTQTLEAYLRKEKITYEIYQEERKIINIRKRKQSGGALLLEVEFQTGWVGFFI